MLVKFKPLRFLKYKDVYMINWYMVVTNLGEGGGCGGNGNQLECVITRDSTLEAH